MPKTATPQPTAAQKALQELIADRCTQLDQILDSFRLAAPDRDYERCADLLAEAMNAAAELTTAGAVHAWVIESKGTWTQGKWTRSSAGTGFGYGYPTLEMAQETVARDQRDAGPERLDQEDNRYRIIPLTVIEGKPITVRHRPPEPGPWPRNEDNDPADD